VNRSFFVHANRYSTINDLMETDMTQPNILSAVQDQYGAVARSRLSNDSAAVRSVAEAFGYSPEELASLPPQANMGLSCGNPVALAGLREGDVVVDLGCGGGLDVLLAAKRVGPTGKAIGIDMTPDMIARAKAGAAQVGATNVEFHLAQIDQLPLPDASVDCVISNCVINLVPDKTAAFREILRVLKPGGRLVVSDIALKQPLPVEVIHDVQAYVGCIAGAIQIGEYERLLRETGFDAVVVQDTGADLNVYAQAGGSGCCSSDGCCSADATTLTASPVHDGLAEVLHQFDANAYAASVRVHALKSGIPSTQKGPATQEGAAMKTIQVYDKPMCCSTGVCGPQVDPVLPRFAADLDWLKTQGHCVERYNLAQQPQAFFQNPEVHRLVATLGTTCLPLIVVDGQIVSRRTYPSREMLSQWTAAQSAASASGCCGGPAQDASQSCCAADEESKITTVTGCGCVETGCC
jgi:SAM-dependent methyltransferase